MFWSRPPEFWSTRFGIAVPSSRATCTSSGRRGAVALTNGDALACDGVTPRVKRCEAGGSKRRPVRLRCPKLCRGRCSPQVAIVEMMERYESLG